MLSFITILYIIHILTCFWIQIGKEGELVSKDSWMTPTIRDWSELKIYVWAMFFIVQTITTVGYGSSGGSTKLEQLYITSLMMVGEFLFLWICGSITSIVTNKDSTNSDLLMKVELVNRLKE